MNMDVICGLGKMGLYQNMGKWFWASKSYITLFIGRLESVSTFNFCLEFIDLREGPKFHNFIVCMLFTTQN